MATSNQAVRSGIVCPECGGRVQSDAAERVCTACGLVVESDRVDHGPEWRAFDAAERAEKKRTKASNRDHHDRGLGSNMGHANERSWRDRRRERLHRHSKAKTKKDRNRGYATGEMERIGNALEVGDSLVKQAKTLFRQVQDADKCIGRDLDTLAATCVYTVCRVHQRGVTPGEVATVARCEERGISRRHKWLCAELGLQVPPPDPRQRIRVVASECGVRHEDVRRVLDRVEELDDAEVCRGSPSVLAAALLYDAGVGLTQAEVSEAAGCTPTAIRQRIGSIG